MAGGKEWPTFTARANQKVKDFIAEFPLTDGN
jgi:hypothetical protein